MYSVHAYPTRTNDIFATLTIEGFTVSCDGIVTDQYDNKAIECSYYRSAKDAIYLAQRYANRTGNYCDVVTDARGYLRVYPYKAYLMPYDHFYVGNPTWGYRALAAWAHRILNVV